MVIGVGVSLFEQKLKDSNCDGEGEDEEKALQNCGVPDINPQCGRKRNSYGEVCQAHYTDGLKECTAKDVRDIAAWLLARPKKSESIL